MIVHPRKKQRYQVQIPLTSLIDIVFLLLVYFLLTTNFMVEEGIKVKLPYAKASSPQKEEEITIYIDKEGKIYFKGRQILLNILFKELVREFKENSDRLVVIKADRKVILNKVVRVMDVAKAAGAKRLCLATEKELW